MGPKNPNTVNEVPLQSKRCTVCCAVSATGTVWSLFFANTVTMKHYKQVLENNLLFLQRVGVQFRGTVLPTGLGSTTYSKKNFEFPS
jgi:hypothetical protein